MHHKDAHRVYPHRSAEEPRHCCSTALGIGIAIAIDFFANSFDPDPESDCHDSSVWGTASLGIKTILEEAS